MQKWNQRSGTRCRSNAYLKQLNERGHRLIEFLPNKHEVRLTLEFNIITAEERKLCFGYIIIQERREPGTTKNKLQSDVFICSDLLLVFKVQLLLGMNCTMTSASQVSMETP